MLVHVKDIQPADVKIGLRQTRLGFQIRIRWIVFASLILASVMPLIGLYKWMEVSALQKEIAYADENHLTIAKNLSATMDRYANDVASIFELSIRSLEGSYGLELREALDSFDLSFVTVMDENDYVLNEVRATSTTTSPRPPPELMAGLRSQAAADPDKTIFSGILQFDGAPHVFLVRNLSDGKLAFAALKLQYLIALQNTIKFGELGHAMIVDQNGIVIAHPNPEWQATSKDASKLSVVQQMMAGETGVATFYSPPMQADMISGFTFVARTGWGVMVPQPMRELIARAKESEHIAAIIVIVEIAFIILMSWWLANLIATPIMNVAKTAKEVSAGNLDARVAMGSASIKIYEADLLGQNFNWVLSDLQSEQNRLNVALNAAHEGERVKSQFLSVMSHEIRTPMHGLMGILELVENGTLEDGQRNLITIGQKAANNMVCLLDNVLQFVRLEFNAQSGKVSKFKPSELAQGAVDLFQPLAMQKGLSLTTSVSDQLLLGDPQIISQILLNLVGNAVKFTEEGQVHIASELRDGSNGKENRLVLSVTDSGIGIDKDLQPKIFDEFIQVDSELSRTNEGTGLGLAISSRLAQLMKGEITLTSEPYKGSCFQLNIPVTVAEV